MVRVLGIVIPIGMPDGAGHRQADVLARLAVGPRWPSVFMTPPRAALTAPDYAAALEIARRVSGKGISRQAWALGPRILEVDAAVACWTARRVAEGVGVRHPDPPEELDGIAASIHA
ncbi:DUF429 domain-containing protein [Promicromonospora sp. NPDC019610]|uniref:DUF429 domain-containing protein n=1 Tax=Promicromonospora sp. NPDC019610 TaxID=3364405 RepID=UPI0037B8A4A7